MRKTATALATLGLGAAAAFSAVPASAADSDTAKLSVLHGVPDTPVDVYVNGTLTLDDFMPGDLAGPLELPGGNYQLAITAADAADASAPIIGPVSADLAAGGNYTATANLDASGNPTANLFTNDTSAVDAGKSRLTVRHVAAAPAVDVLAGGTPVIEGLTNPNEKALTVDAGTVSASVAAAGTTTPVIGPADLALAEGTNTIVYAWGSLEAGNLALATQTIEGLHSAPQAVPGAMEQVAQSGDDQTLTAAAAVGGVALLTLGAALLRRRATVSDS
ncbi:MULTISPECIES: DUF4397 domain-containing protein [unclassified Arthrobacter]|uniref:DUF4397 domain-containing protein n=1 Tax=unclassified Arthrobacter TaxID=235627 RepID=UPI001D137564|nr:MULTISPECIES: DUF4397 domain-containing protein [unclassified Arthrobacter]MCC3291481.1 DUF4397 domain-containing protein [Arthrobacter sp. zg-Y1110]MCC3301145.1 DUF4397 domain-containing protein [Arthrobacter sp. zg-Y895]MCC3302392.1 DUF4397 domain-containing protein [Arthrobacter sp. zg-Y895]UWX83894.1 DUF4397 domain-containing protein [Arthrobacter sp. zg-Y1110]